MSEATVERIRLFLIESPIKMARLQGVGNVKGTVKRVLIELTSSACGKWFRTAISSTRSRPA